MSKKIKISKIEIETKGEKPVRLTLREAKELYEQLHELFGEKKVIEERIRWTGPYYYPYTYPTKWYESGSGWTFTTDNTSVYSSELTGMTVTLSSDIDGSAVSTDTVLLSGD